MKIDLDKLIVIGDRVLIKPLAGSDKTKTGLYLPAGYKDKEEIQKGYILKCGPGYALPSFDDNEPWSTKKANNNYLPLQVKAGDLAIFLQKGATEIKYNGEKYYIVPQNAIMLVERDSFE
ncbi:MAG: co-chaperone GroES [Bacteroidales bacterium]|nr:co-chaperone GroES [Bacteroidales bacterium]